MLTQNITIRHEGINYGCRQTISIQSINKPQHPCSFNNVLVIKIDLS